MSNKLFEFTSGECFLVTEIESKPEIPLECPICNYVMRDDHDAYHYTVYKACTDCCMYGDRLKIKKKMESL